MRVSTATAYQNTIDNLTARQSGLATLQDQLSAGKKIITASDDPAGAAQAERSSTRISRLQADTNALALAKDSMSTAESTLGDSVTLLESARDALVTVGNGSISTSDRATLVTQLSDLRDQLLGLANQKDSNGQFVFSGQGSTGTPFVGTSGAVAFTGNAGQPMPQQGSVPHSLDGNALFMSVPSGNGVFSVAAPAANSGTGWTDSGQVVTPAALTGNNYAINFSVVAGTTSYSVVDTTTAATVVAAQPYVSGQPIQFDGQAVTVKGTPATGDQFLVQPSTRTSVFNVLDQAIAGLTAAGANPGQVMQNVQQGIAGLDLSMDRLQAGRSEAGLWMNRADASSTRMGNQSTQLTAGLSQAQDLDMVKALSDFQTQQTAYTAALKSYAQVQQLSLFQYIQG